LDRVNPAASDTISPASGRIDQGNHCADDRQRDEEDCGIALSSGLHEPMNA